MAHNFSNLGEIHSCPNFIAWYYWIIKHNYFLKIERVSPAFSLALPSHLQRLWQREGGRGSQCFPWVQAHIALFILDWVIGPCRQRLISHREFPTKVAWVLGGNQRRNCFQVLPGLPAWLWGKPREEVQGARAQEAKPGLAWYHLLAKCPRAAGSNLKVLVCSPIK